MLISARLHSAEPQVRFNQKYNSWEIMFEIGRCFYYVKKTFEIEQLRFEVATKMVGFCLSESQIFCNLKFVFV